MRKLKDFFKAYPSLVEKSYNSSKPASIIRLLLQNGYTPKPSDVYDVMRENDECLEVLKAFVEFFGVDHAYLPLKAFVEFFASISDVWRNGEEQMKKMFELLEC